jgi:hypothetical protein
LEKQGGMIFLLYQARAGEPAETVVAAGTAAVISNDDEWPKVEGRLLPRSVLEPVNPLSTS